MKLGITPTSVVPTTIANGQIVQVPHALATAVMESTVQYVQAGISNGAPLLGLNFLTKFKYRAIVDCRNHRLLLDKPDTKQ
ncbi:MAG: hypothetical protein AAB592_00945 [Patescibacteria group bacterium]